MRKEVENVLFYIAASKGGQATISKRLVEEIENAFKSNEDMCLKRKSLKEREAYKIALVTAKLPDEVYQNIIGYFNQRMGKTLSWKTKETQRLINARFAEGYGVEDFKKVIDNKILSWQSDKKMCKYLRPSTLFGNHFDEYLNEVQTAEKPWQFGGKSSLDMDEVKKNSQKSLAEQVEERLKRRLNCGFDLTAEGIEREGKNALLSRDEIDMLINKYA